ncbi:MAG TPA: PEP/pyruvate-binding domain-containing protein, partial [Thiomonas arsenitoxydans]|nr:PEP/pyruvate-binding domain-containing protein [Thiomonas arsenitoxydans]
MTQQNTAHSGNELILQLDDVRMSDIDQVGGKNASLGEMISQLSGSGVRVPGGFATTAHAFRQFLRAGGLGERIETMLKELDADDVRALERCGAQIRQWVIETPFPADLEQA